MLNSSLARFVSPLTIVCVAGWLCLSGCGDPAPKKNMTAQTGGKKDGHDDEHEKEGHHHHHAEKGPHDGALVAIGEDAAHLEVVLNAETGELTAYVLDGEAKEAVAIAAEKLEIDFTLEHADDKKDELPEATTITLTAVEPADGKASQFAGQSDQLKEKKEFDAVLRSITIGEKEHTKVNFNYPKGNEHDHHHH